MPLKIVNPNELGAPRGYSNGMLADPAGKLLFVAGQIAWDRDHQIVSDDFVQQFDRALANVISVVAEAGGSPNDLTRLAIYVTNKREYLERTVEVGECYRKHMGKHFPAMVMVEVNSLLDEGAKVEIEGIAVLN